MISHTLYNGEIKLDFDEKKHWFYANDKIVKSVTSYTGILDKSVPLVIWATRLNKDWLLEKAPKIAEITDIETIKELIEESSKQHQIKKEKAADIGTQAHDWVEKFVAATKENKKPPALPKDKQVHNAVMAFLKWANDLNIKFLENELHIYSRKFKYAGILDAIALIGNKRVLIDFKTSNSIDYPEYALQTAGYMLAWEEMTGKNIDKRILVRFGKDTAGFETKELNDFKRDKDGFLACVKLKNVIDTIKKDDRETNKRNSGR